MKTTRTRIASDWTVMPVAVPDMDPALQLPPIPAEVPGYVHLDLQRAGVIPDPFYRLHERDVAWVDDADWIYQTSFNIDDVPVGDVLLSFLGLDTVADVSLNDQPVGRNDNMFVPCEFNIGPLLHAGQNSLQITFHSARRVGLERHAAWSKHHDSMPAHPFLWSARSFVRKAQYMFGWDWGPILISCGIWRPVELVAVPMGRLLDWRYDVSFADRRATLQMEVAVQRASGALDSPLHVTAAIPEKQVSTTAEVPAGSGRLHVPLTIEIDDPQHWSPSHPALHGLELTLQSGQTVVDSHHTRLGLRTVELIREPDPDGQGDGFLLRVNGENLFCKGANWIPADSFPSATYDNRDRLYPLIAAAKEAGFNMLRVWGGGMYESDVFYDLCDELGILVWQDFPYACAYYPDDPDALAIATAEARASIRRLRVHPSLAMWCGNNENHQMFHDNWQDLNPPRFIGQPIYDTVLPRVIAEENPGTPYWPGSAFGGENPNSPDAGDRHNWDVWHAHGASDGDWSYYTHDRARFCSEFGFAASCGMTAWNTCLAPADRDPTSAAVRWHDKTRKDYDVYLGYVERHFPSVRSLDDLVYYSQLNQAEAMRFGVEHYRRLKGRCWGTLIWQLNDCWPVQSWAMIDYTGERKAAYFAANRFYAPVLLSLVRNENLFDVYLVNDLTAPVTGRLRLHLARFDGTVLSEVHEAVSMETNGVGQVARISLSDTPADAGEIFVHAYLDSEDPRACVENVAFLVEPKELHVTDPRLRTTVSDTDDALAIAVEAERFAPYVWLAAPGLDPVQWSDNFFHLRPGHPRTITVPRRGHMNADVLRDRLEVRSFSPS